MGYGQSMNNKNGKSSLNASVYYVNAVVHRKPLKNFWVGG